MTRPPSAVPGVPNQCPDPPQAALDATGHLVGRTMLEWRPMSSAPPGSPTIKVANPSDGGFWYWLGKFYAFGAICVAGALFVVGGFTYLYFARTLPNLPDLATYHQTAATTTIIRAWDGTPLAELANQRREILPFER